MLDASAIKQLALAEAITAASTAIALRSGLAVVALPKDFETHDLEQYLPNRRRVRGTMTTSVLDDFANYAETHAEQGNTVFIDKDNMTATAVLNLGTPDAPGHADNRAVLALETTAAYQALLKIASGHPLRQVDVAEFIEDWAPYLRGRAGEEEISAGKAAAAVRNITIEALRKQNNTEQQLGATKSAFESVQASSTEALPQELWFAGVPPYVGLVAREFVLRLSVLTGDKPSLVLRIVKHDEHKEAMASEFAEQVRGALVDVPVAIGTYKKAA